MGNTPFNDEVDLEKNNLGNNPVDAYNRKVITFNKERVRHETVNGVISILGAVGGLCINLFVPEGVLTTVGLRAKPETKESSTFNNTLIQIALGIARVYIGYLLLFGIIAPLIPFGKVIMIALLLAGIIKEYRNTEKYENKKQNKPDVFEKRYQELVEEGQAVAQKEQEWRNAIDNQRQSQTQPHTSPTPTSATSSSTEEPFDTFYDGSDTNL